MPSSDDLQQLYQEVILEHYGHPHNKETLDQADVGVEMYNPSCGDTIVLQLKFDEEGRIDKIAFNGEGCSISQSSVSMMTDLLKGKSVEEARRIEAAFRAMMRGESDIDETQLGDLVALQGVARFPVRIKCATLGWNALDRALTLAESGGGEKREEDQG